MSESEAESAKSPSAESTNEPGEQDEIANYAQTAIQEMLGWYGLQDSGESADGQRNSSGGQMPALTPEGLTSCNGPPGTTVNGWDTQSNGPKTEQHKSEGTYSNPGSPTGDGRRSNSRKFIGMRYLFPAPPESSSLLDKAQLWVARHNQKYFVGWSAEQLESVDPALRPLQPISPEMYKLHMNRSEFCRNVKLKYCLESDAEWAAEFRERLRNPLSDGGFSGLCQAKIVAAELWRKYSENYKGHQARYPNPKSRLHRMRRHGNGHLSPTEGSMEIKYEVDLWGQDGMEEGVEGYDGEEECCASRCSNEAEEYNSGPAKISKNGDAYSEAVFSGVESQTVSMADPGRKDANQNVTQYGLTSGDKTPLSHNNSPNGEQPPLVIDSSNPTSAAESCVASSMKSAVPLSSAMPPSVYTSSPTILHTLAQPVMIAHSAAQPPMTSAVEQPSVAVLTSSALSALHLAYPSLPATPGLTPGMPLIIPQPQDSAGIQFPPTPATPDANRGQKMVFRPSEYKKSERGLSYLFPSLADQQLSLMDKVRITVLRHKNNYFLDWTPAELSQVAPIVRPKMVVTRELYKEYCHRNAMKYDSNLQFAMESAEPWAEEFRVRLSCPPSEGGFHSLCEVKQEAGRLWREFSGKYKMHNVVKAQMDLNSEATQAVRQDTISKGNKKMARELLQRTTKDVQAALEELHRAGYANGTSVPADGLASSPSPGQGSVVRSASMGALQLSPSLSPCSTATEASGGTEDSISRKRRGPEESKSEEPYKQPRVDGVKTEAVPMSPWASPLSSSPQVALDGSRGDGHLRHEALTAALRSAGPLFPALPTTLSVAQQAAIWLQRHQHSYFLGVPAESLPPLPPLVRPLLTVTESLYSRCIPLALVSGLQQLGLVMTASSGPAVSFQERLTGGRYESLEQALLDAMDVWNKHVSAEYILLADGRYPNPARQQPLCDKVDRSTDAGSAKGVSSRSPETLTGSQSVLSPPDVKPLLPLGQLPTPLSIPKPVPSEPRLLSPQSRQQQQKRPLEHSPDAKRSGLSDNAWYRAGTRSPDDHDTDLSHDVLDLSMSSSSKLVLQPAPEGSRSAGTLVHQIWQLRSKLQQACRDDPSVSLHARLQTYTNVLREQLGTGYELPSNPSDCLVDLMLASVHKHLSQS